MQRFSILLQSQKMASIIKKVVLVTGGSRGIGATLVKKMASQNYFVYFNYSSSDKEAKRLVTEIGPQNVKAIKANITSLEEMKKISETIINEKGQIDVLINNAGITRDKPLMMMTEGEWADVINTNLNGSFNATRAVIVPMMKAKTGRIVFVSSVTGLAGMKGQVNYAATKAGMIGMMKSLAKEVATLGITVNAVAPGFIESDMTAKLPEKYRTEALKEIPMQKFGSTEDVANLVSFLISDAASYITGEVIRVDGGLAI